MRPRLGPPTLLAAVLLLAGCAGNDGRPAETTSVTPAEPEPPLKGWVLDPAVMPVSGAQVTIHGTDAATATDGQGVYRFPSVPLELPIVIIVEAPGYSTSSKGVTVPEDGQVVLNFTLEPVPVRRAFHETFPLKGFVSCQAGVVVAEEEQNLDCSGGSDPNDKPILEFNLQPDAAGIILELQWEPSSTAAESLQLTAETVGFGDQDQVLATAVGRSVLRAQVSELQAQRYYSAGGTMRVTVAAGTEPDEEEASAGASVPLQQAFTLHASVFYVRPPDPSFSAVTG